VDAVDSEPTPELERRIEEEVERRLGERIAALEERLARLESGQAPEAKARRVTLLVHSGDMDRLMAAFMVASGAVAMGHEVSMFFTFWGLSAVKKKTSFHGKSITERALALALPGGPAQLGTSRLNFLGVGPRMFEGLMREHNVKTLPELIALCGELGVRFVACQTTMSLMGVRREELLDSVDVGGVATYLGDALDSRLTLFF
jgi:peroxiredoxin family protein